MALIGPGDPGQWKPDRLDEEFDGGFVRRFASEIKIGDVILLRTGVATITAVGLVGSDYLYLSAFDDVNGWDLQQGRRVRWCRLPEGYVFRGTPFGASPSRCSRVQSRDVLDYAERFLKSPPSHWQTALLPDLPAEEPPLEDVPEALRVVVAQARDLAPLVQDQERFGDLPCEDELIAHSVVPFLRALGWPPERIGVKWKRVDVALFSALPRSPATCRLIIEAKRLGSGVEGALKQAREYLEALGVVRDVVVTDGIRYRMYAGDDGFNPVAYANFARLKRSAVKLFDRMLRP